MFDRIGFILGEAISALRRNGFMSFAAISTVAVSLFVIGGAGYLYISAIQYAEKLPGKFDMRVYLKDGTSYEQITQTAQTIRGMDGVATVHWMPKEAVWELEKQKAPELHEGIDNPYPDGYKVTITDLEFSDEVAASISKLPVVEEGGVRYLKEEFEVVNQGIKGLQWLGAPLGGLLLLTAGILIFNAIRLAFLSRKLEIRVMRLVGASPFTVFTPFLIEGCVQGVLGGVIAAGLLYLANWRFGLFFMNLSSMATVPEFPFQQAAMILAAVGGAFGVFCSFLSLSMRREAR